MDASSDIRTVMSSPLVGVAPGAPAAHAAWLLWEREIGAVPVIGDQGLLGLITDGDLLRLGDFDGHIAVDVMSAPVMVVRADTPVDEAARIMGRHGVGHLPVVDDDGNPIGMISRSDVLAVRLPADPEVRRQVIDRVIDVGGEVLGVHVENGGVRLCVRVGGRDEAAVVERLVREIDGVVALDASFSYLDELSGEPVRG